MNSSIIRCLYHSGIAMSTEQEPIKVNINKLGAENFNKKVLINGIIISTNSIESIIIKASFACKKCGTANLIDQEDDDHMILPEVCSSGKCTSKRFHPLDQANSVFDDYQELYIQEPPDEISAGKIPKSVLVKAYGKLTDYVRIGDRVDIIGTLRHLRHKKVGLVFTPYVKVEKIIRHNEIPEDLRISDGEKKQIMDLGKNPFVHDIIINSIVPSIQGRMKLKRAMMYALFGGVKVETKFSRRRGDINVLFIGDPSTGRSELLMGAARIAPRGLYTSGKGSTAAGLTATVTKDGVTGKWHLQGGALVIGDKGVVCIDEIDKMAKKELGAIHTAMEQQIIPINKAGINRTLNARNTIIAACNPVEGYYNSYEEVAENIGDILDQALLTRFDLIFIVKDTPDIIEDDKIAKHMLDIHRDIDPNIEIIDEKFLKKYISYAKSINPKLSNGAKNILDDFYQDVRRQMRKKQLAVGFSPRQLQGLMRLTEAHARIALKEIADDNDAIAAIEIMQESLKDVGTAEREIGSMIKTREGRCQVAMKLLTQLERGKDSGVNEESWIEAMRDKRIDNPQRVIRELTDARKIQEYKTGYWKTI